MMKITLTNMGPLALPLTTLLLLSPVGLLASEAPSALVGADAAWKRRHDGHQGPRAQAGPIAEAIGAYEVALTSEPAHLEARWKLLRAMYFEGEYVLEDADERLALFQRAKEVADQGRAQLRERFQIPENSESSDPARVAADLADVPNAAEIYFWSAVHWGLWGRYRGKIAAAREGVAKKIRQFAEVVILMDEEMEEAGGHRILGRLHAEAPKLPFFTGWVSRDKAISELRRAMELAPEGLLTHLYLAEALLEYRPQQRTEAIEILRALARRSPAADHLVEETKTIEDAKVLLASLGE